jgi:23S rRNA-intervening sequence protein
MGQSYRDLIAWKEGMGFVSDLYRATQGFPRNELYGLTSQLRRAPYRSQATSRKVKHTIQRENSIVFSVTQEVPWLKSKHK